MQLTTDKMDSHSGLQTIGKYQIVGTLGRGSMGIVYKGRDPEIGRLVAIKTLRKISAPQFRDSSTSLERFKLEARSAGNLRHPNIITIFDVSIEGDMPYIVMDYVEGESLDQILSRSGRIEPALLIHYLGEAAAGLDHAHQHGVIHRDVKPSNIIVDKSQRVFLLDFGIASMNDSFSENPGEQKDQTVMGTPGYMSPEQILNQKLDKRSDIFSLAVVAFECLCGKRPFPGDNFTQVVANILNSKPLALSSLAPELPLALESELERALSRDREQRFSSASEMVNSLRYALGIKSINSETDFEGKSAAPTRRRRVSTWKSLSALTRQSGKGPTNVDRAPEPQEADYHPVWSPETQSPAQARNVSGNYSDNPFFPQTRDVLARNVQPLGQGALQFGAVPSAMRFALWVLAFICLFTSGYLFWRYLNPAGAGRSAVKQGVAVNRSQNQQSSADSLSSEDLPMPKYDPVPSGKSVEEMSDREVLGVLASKDQPESMSITALREALTRKIPGLAAISAFSLQSDSYIVRIETLKTLAALGDKRVVPRILVSLDDYDPLVRAQAARTLGALGSRAALGYLSARMLKEDSPQVKFAIKAATDQINGL